ncbi:MAG TPA: MFS transporter [Thermoanaerobaculia bacterium]|jgi:MFS family permease|nr:MFS transporter [Thermoanaerobaculia bacterium]
MQSSSLKQLWVLMAIVFVDMIGSLLVAPLLPFYAKDMGARPLVVGMILSAFFLAQLLSAPYWGRFSDRYGRRPALLIGLASSAVAFALFGLANSILLLFVFRLIQGAGGGTTGVVQAYVSDAVPPEKRAEALGWISAATNAGVMIGPALGSLAHKHFGTPGPGFAAAILCTLNVIAAWKWLPESRKEEHPPMPSDVAATAAAAARPSPPRPRQPLLKSVFKVLSDPGSPVSLLIWIYAIGMLAFMGMNGVLGLYLGKAYGVTSDTSGYFYSYVGAIGVVMRALLLGPTVRRFGEIGVTRMGSLSLVLGLVLIPIPAMLSLTRMEQLVALALILVLVPVGTALLFPATTALVSHRASRFEMGQTMGVQQAFGSAARVLGPICSTWIYEVDVRFPFWIAAAVMLATSFLTSRLTRPEPEKVAVEAPATDRA